IDDSTVRFGDKPNEGAAPSHFGLEDKNGDGITDKVYHFPFQETNLDREDKIGYLSGKINGENFVGSSDVNITGRGGGSNGDGNADRHVDNDDNGNDNGNSN